MRDPLGLVGRTVDEREARFSRADTCLYALATGLGSDPLDARQLRYVWEEDLQALPAMSLVLAYPGFWLKDPQYGVDWTKVLHAEEGLEIHAPLPAEGTVRGRTTVTRIIDRGADKGALVYSSREVRHGRDDTLLATIESCTLLRGDGGFGGPSGPLPPPVVMPGRAPDAVCDLSSLPQQALLYRLCGDFNPLHADPAVARQAGFDRPILHGRCTLAIAQHALLRLCCGYEASRLRHMRVRFTAPFFPGETLRTLVWREGSTLLFSAEAVERGVKVLDQGTATIVEPGA